MPATKIVARALAPLLALGLAAPALATHETPPWQKRQRIYLMAAETDYTYWSVDRGDPELSVGSIVQHCGTTESWRYWQRQKPCFGGGAATSTERSYGIFFMPGTLFETAPTWSAQDPLRFHFELGVDALATYTVHFVIQSGTSLSVSPAATQVAPGVFEGTMGSGGPLDLSRVNFLGVRVTTSSPRAILDLKLRGASWVDLPQPVGAKAVTDLRAEDTYQPQPTTYASDTRTMTFNDADWSSWSFTGDTNQVRTFDLELARDAVALVGWVEAFSSPFVHDVVRRLDPDARKLTDGVGLRVLREGEEIADAPGPYFGVGTVSLAANAVDAGPLTLEVPLIKRGDEPLQYRVHLVAVHGARTLDSMRWLGHTQYMFRVPMAASCPGATQPLPVMPEVRSFLVDLDWDTEAPGLAAWTLSFGLPGVGDFPCGEEAGGDWVRFTLPGEDVWYVGPTAAKHGQFASAFDTAFEFEVRYTYSPPPIEHAA